MGYSPHPSKGAPPDFRRIELTGWRITLHPPAPEAWAVSSVGRASRLHREGRGFEPLTAHQFRREETVRGTVTLSELASDSARRLVKTPSGGRSPRRNSQAINHAERHSESFPTTPQSPHSHFRQPGNRRTMRLGNGARPLEVDTPPSSASAFAPGQPANATCPGAARCETPADRATSPLPRPQPQRF